MKAFDFDGVVSIGIHPGPNDVIITGRSFDEAHIVNKILKDRGIMCAVYFNPITTEARTTGGEQSRRCSGRHKANIIGLLKSNGSTIELFFEDDEMQIEEINRVHPGLTVVHIKHDLVEK